MKTIDETGKVVDGCGDKTDVLLLVEVEGGEECLEAELLTELDEEVDVFDLLHVGTRREVKLFDPVVVNRDGDASKKDPVLEEIVKGSVGVCRLAKKRLNPLTGLLVLGSVKGLGKVLARHRRRPRQLDVPLFTALIAHNASQRPPHHLPGLCPLLLVAVFWLSCPPPCLASGLSVCLAVASASCVALDEMRRFFSSLP